jgi:hypothetical protein
VCRFTKSFPSLILATLFLALAAWPLVAEPALRFKAWTAGKESAEVRTAAREPRRLRAERRYLIVEFDGLPPEGQWEAAAGAGVQFLRYVPDNAVLVSAPVDFASDALAASAVMEFPLEAKISPLMLVAVAEPAPVHFLAEFHPDVSPGDAREIALREGLLPREHPDLVPGQLMLEGSREQMESLTQWDEVAYVFPASEELQRGRAAVACAGALTDLGPIGQYIRRIGEGWDGPGRGAASLGYSFERLTDRLPAAVVEAEIRRAFAEWSRYVAVDFLHRPGQNRASRHINILFAAGPHGDAYPFDGPGRTLAHTFYPAPPNPEPIAGDMHFDEDEAWRTGGGVDVYSVALHEMGHALGLGHSDDPNAVMYAFYRQAGQLTPEDVNAIREMYSARETETAPPADPIPPQNPQPNPPPQAPDNPAPPSNPAPAPPANPAPNPPQTPTAGPDRTAPTLAITSPGSILVQASADSYTMRGTARDNVAVVEVRWKSSNGDSGVATGTVNWTIPGVRLLRGTNTVVVRARDAAGNETWRSVMIVRR